MVDVGHAWALNLPHDKVNVHGGARPGPPD